MKIYLVRHGESESNAKGIIGSLETGLTEKGIAQAKELGEKLSKENIPFDVVYCSNMRRGRQTLEEFIKAGLNVNEDKIFTTDLINEIDRKEFEGKPTTEYYAARDASGLDPNEYKCEGGESEMDVRKRAMEFKEMVEKSGFENILVISHGHFLGQLTSIYDIKDIGRNGNGSLLVLEITDGKANVVSFDKTF